MNYSQALLLCEDEKKASELSLQLSSIDKKLWINPLQYDSVDQLPQINPSLFQDYAQQGIIISTSQALQHLELLCRQALDQFQNLSGEQLIQKQVIEHAEKELIRLQDEKQQLALRWIYASLKRLFLRDQERFK